MKEVKSEGPSDALKQIIEREQTKGGLMKYLRLRLEGSTKKVYNNRGAPSPSFVLGPGGNRGQAATYKEGPY